MKSINVLVNLAIIYKRKIITYLLIYVQCELSLCFQYLQMVPFVGDFSHCSAKKAEIKNVLEEILLCIMFKEGTVHSGEEEIPEQRHVSDSIGLGVLTWCLEAEAEGQLEPELDVTSKIYSQETTQ